MNDLDCILNEIYRPEPDERLVTCLLGFLLVNQNKYRAFQSRLTYQEQCKTLDIALSNLDSLTSIAKIIEPYYLHNFFLTQELSYKRTSILTGVDEQLYKIVLFIWKKHYTDE